MSIFLLLLIIFFQPWIFAPFVLLDSFSVSDDSLIFSDVVELSIFFLRIICSWGFLIFIYICFIIEIFWTCTWFCFLRIIVFTLFFLFIIMIYFILSLFSGNVLFLLFLISCWLVIEDLIFFIYIIIFCVCNIFCVSN